MSKMFQLFDSQRCNAFIFQRVATSGTETSVCSRSFTVELIATAGRISTSNEGVTSSIFHHIFRNLIFHSYVVCFSDNIEHVYGYV